VRSAPRVIEVPDPSVVVLVGAAGSGKSTFAARHFAPGEILSSDAFREAIAGDAADQAATKPAFAALHRSLSRRLAEGRLTVVDATSVQPAARRALVLRASTAGVPAVAIVLDLPATVVHARNLERPDRVVPSEAVDAQLEALGAAMRAGSLAAVGFAAVYRLWSADEVDAVVVVRRRP
jgi:predicted kinase